MVEAHIPFSHGWARRCHRAMPCLTSHQNPVNRDKRKQLILKRKGPFPVGGLYNVCRPHGWLVWVDTKIVRLTTKQPPWIYVHGYLYHRLRAPLKLRRANTAKMRVVESRTGHVGPSVKKWWNCWDRSLLDDMKAVAKRATKSTDMLVNAAEVRIGVCKDRNRKTEISESSAKFRMKSLALALGNEWLCKDDL